MAPKGIFELSSIILSLVPIMLSGDIIASRRVARICVVAGGIWLIAGLVLAYYLPLSIEPVLTLLTFSFPAFYLTCFFILWIIFKQFTGVDPYITWQPSSPGEPPVDGMITKYKNLRPIRLSDFAFSFAQFLVPMAVVWIVYSQVGPPIPQKYQQKYPAVWFAPINDPNKPSWEILPQEAKAGEVILSKRNELGILSNFAATPFELDGKRYASVEGFWQAMLYPEPCPDCDPDPRMMSKKVTWKYYAFQVERMTGFEAKEAGTLAEENMKKLGIDWCTYQGKRFPYRSATPGEHYRLIVAAMRAKLEQNPEVKRILLATGDLILKPDHHGEDDPPPEWLYCDIWMQLRTELRK